MSVTKLKNTHTHTQKTWQLSYSVGYCSLVMCETNFRGVKVGHLPVLQIRTLSP